MQEYTSSRHANNIKTYLDELIKKCQVLITANQERREKKREDDRKLEKERQDKRNQYRSTGDL